MDFAFLDESGDNGKNGSKYLVLTLLCTHKKKQLVKIIREAKRRLLKNNKCSKWLNQKGGEIKFYGFPDKTLLKKVLHDLSLLEGNIYFITLDKKNKAVNPDFKPVIVGNLFSHILGNDTGIEKIVADLNFFNTNKENYFKLIKFSTTSTDSGREKSESNLSFSKIDKNQYYKSLKNNENVIKIEHQNSRLSEELQALDLLCGAIAIKFERDCSEYFEIISKNKLNVLGESCNFKNNN